jgi:acetyl-CoA synthetase
MPTTPSGSYLPNKALFKDSYFSSLEDYKKLYYDSIENVSDFWEKQAREQLHWQHDFQMVSDCDFSEGLVSWFLGGKINACENAVDRHVKDRGDQVAIIWEPDEPGKEVRITYRELQRKV